ncbi:MAG: hypothetical protein ACPL0F_00450 [bacterium]
MKRYRRTGSTPILSKPWLWVVIAVTVLFALFLLSRTLSQSPPAKPTEKTVSLNRQDLDTYTRMAGSILFDTTLLLPLNPDRHRLLKQVLKMVGNRELADAISRLNRLLRGQPVYEQGLMQLLIGICYYELGQPEPALNAFKTGARLLATEQNPAPGTARLLALHTFNAGYLFQFYSQPDSARRYYQLSQQALALAQPDQRLTAIILNNLALTFEAAGDTQRAQSLYLEAAKLIDTTLNSQSAERIRKNIHRLVKQSPAGQHQS